MAQLNNKVAVITGAAQGAGRGCALAYAKEGASLVLVGRTEETLEELNVELQQLGAQTLVVVADVGKLKDIQRCVTKTIEIFGTIDILVNSAQSPSMRSANLLEIDRHVMDQLWQTGPVASLELMRACHPYLKGGGSIINFGSGAQFVPGGYGVYAAAKSAINMITRAAAVEWGSDGIRANLVVPMVHSAANDEAMAAEPQLEKMLINSIPLGRIGDPEQDVGRALVFLGSDESRYVTGTTLMLDGGQQFLH
jgi:meso-butanediol dehydrogenase/(S,S)-butanediol dehydrogenase/diacetyl reductase